MQQPEQVTAGQSQGKPAAAPAAEVKQGAILRPVGSGVVTAAAQGALWLALAACAAASLTAYAYWPGLMTWDPVRQYGEALSGEITDWHPPMMQWVWQRLLAIHPGPAPMLVLQLGLYWGGLALLAAAIRRDGRRGLAWAVLACGLLPLGMALTGAILKDCVMAGALLAATGLLAWRGGRGGASGLAAAALLLFAATLRFNAFAACLPLLVALLPRAWWRSWPRLLATAAVATAMLVAAMPIANRLIGAEPSGVELSLVIFDLGGITEHGGASVFPEEMAVRDPVRANHRCYNPNKWDSYSDWVEPECPLGFTAWNDDVAPDGVKPYPFWLRTVLTHPLPYAEHRLTHFAINTRLLPLPDATERPVPVTTAPNPWGFRVSDNRVLHLLDALAVASAHTPLGWPIVWMAVALGAAIAGWPRRRQGGKAASLAEGAWAEGQATARTRLIVPLALSSLLYGCGYMVFSVASELRYHLWTELAALLAAVLAAGGAPLPRRRLAWSCAPPVLAVLACIATRV